MKSISSAWVVSVSLLALSAPAFSDIPSTLTVAEASATDPVPESSEPVSEKVSDAWITTKIKSAYLYTKEVPGTDVNVDTADGVVTLTGVVHAAHEKDKAIEIAQNVRGVRKVNANNLQIQETAHDSSNHVVR